MRTSVIIAVSVATALVAGCMTFTSHPSGGGRTAHHEPQDCRGAGVCVIRLDPVTGAPPEHVLAKKDVDTPMIWQIHQDSTLRFDAPGIVFASDAGFTCNSNPTPNGKQVACKNTGKPSDHYYTIRLKRQDGTAFEIDPFVWNF